LKKKIRSKFDFRPVKCAPKVKQANITARANIAACANITAPMVYCRIRRHQARSYQT